MLWFRVYKILVFEVDGFCYISSQSVLFLIFYSLISRELLISRTPIKNTIFWKSMIKSLRWIEVNCFNIFRFLAVSTSLQKMHYFGQFKDITRERNQTNDPIFFIYFLNSNCLWYSFLYLKITKVDFHGVLLSSILVCKIPEFWRCKGKLQKNGRKNLKKI